MDGWHRICILLPLAGDKKPLLIISGYDLPWEEKSFKYPNNFAPALEIAIQASNGASDYGNKFGEPVVLGFARSFGMEIVPGDRREYIKPIMFSGGIGQLEGSHISKEIPVKGEGLGAPF